MPQQSTLSQDASGGVSLSIEKKELDELLKHGSWCGRTITVIFRSSSRAPSIEQTCRLDPIDIALVSDTSGFQHPLADAYQILIKDNHDEYQLILKVPRLRVLKGAGCSLETLVREEHGLLMSFLSECRKAFQREYAMSDRFPNTPPVLPVLYYAKYDNTLKESVAPNILYASLEIPCVLRSKVAGMSLLRWMRKEERRKNGVQSLMEWKAIAESLFNAAQQLHTERATHGFICPGNIIVDHNYNPLAPDRNHLSFINAGDQATCVYMVRESAEIETVPGDPICFPDSTKINPIRRSYDSPESLYRWHGGSDGYLRFEVDDNNVHYSSTDIFSIGVTLAYLATGQEDVYKIVAPYQSLKEIGATGWQEVRGRCRRTPYHLMKAGLLDALFGAACARRSEREAGNDGTRDTIDDWKMSLIQSEVILQCTRSREERRAEHCQHALKIMRLFCDTHLPETSQDIQDESMKKLGDQLWELAKVENLGLSRVLARQILKKTTENGDSCDSIIEKLLAQRFNAAFARIANLRSDFDAGVKISPSVRIIGSRTTITEAFLAALSELKSTDMCIAVTTPAIWSGENLGPTSRVSTMIQLKRLQGCRFEWIMMVPDTELFSERVQQILAYRAADDLWFGRLCSDHHLDRTVYPSDAFYYVSVPLDEYQDILAAKKTFIGICHKDNGENNPEGLAMHIAPDFSERSGRLVAMTYWSQPWRATRLLKQHKLFSDGRVPARNFERVM